MSNNITQKYFSHPDFTHQGKEALAKIAAQVGFQPGKEIFRGQIYDQNKVGSLIYQGIWQNKPAVLKIQGLRPDVDEIKIIEKFNNQNKSLKIRLPKLYKGLKWNERDGFGYLLLEYIDAPKIYQPPFSGPKEIKDFCAFFKEYKTKCCCEPFFKKESHEENSLTFVAERVSHWRKIAVSKGHLLETEVKNMERFLALASRHLPSIKMEFMHGHLTYDDIFKVSEEEYVIMSNLFWSYRPEFYDSTFHLWAGIKSLRDQSVTAKEIKEYLKIWLESYKKLPVIAKDSDFERKFDLMMAERCLCAPLVDLQNQYYEKDRGDHVAHLTRLFRELFEYFAAKLERTRNQAN